MSEDVWDVSRFSPEEVLAGVEVFRAITFEQRAQSLAWRVLTHIGLENYDGRKLGEPLDRYDTPETDFFTGFWRWSPIASGRTIYDDCPSAPIVAQQNMLPPGKIAEASRVAVLDKVRGTFLSRTLIRQILGCQIQRTIERGYDYWVVTIRCYDSGSRKSGGMFWLLRHFPWELGIPVSYPPELGGPDVEEPILTATLKVDLVAPALWAYDEWSKTQPDVPYQNLYGVTLPGASPPPQALEDDWTDFAGELVERANSNQRKVNTWIRDWEEGELRLLPVQK